MPDTAPSSKRSGSQKRQRKHALKIALNDEELANVADKAQACGLSYSSYGRASMLGTPGPRARRSPTINAEALGRATAALNKVGSNLNQIAHGLNAGGFSMTLQECFAALAEARAAAAAIREIVGRKDRP
jgi:methionine synthase I (cobalamin-dependent)